MATLANDIFDRFHARPSHDATNAAAHAAVANPEGAFRLRMFPNEDVYFFIKRIDNSLVIRESDPKTRRTCWSVIGSSCAVAVFLTGLLLPSLQGLLAGYRIESLRQDKHRLELERATLEFQETKLLTTEHLNELAEKQKFVDPSTPQQLFYLEGKPDGTLAQATAAPAVDKQR
jgi:hypothetical protein